MIKIKKEKSIAKLFREYFEDIYMIPLWIIGVFKVNSELDFELRKSINLFEILFYPLLFIGRLILTLIYLIACVFLIPYKILNSISIVFTNKEEQENGTRN